MTTVNNRADVHVNAGVLNAIMQVGLVGFTVFGFLLTSLKLPQYGLAANFVSQIFWGYCAYKAWREANQIGIFVVTIFIVFILLGGIINYWFDFDPIARMVQPRLFA